MPGHEVSIGVLASERHHDLAKPNPHSLEVLSLATRRHHIDGLLSEAPSVRRWDGPATSEPSLLQQLLHSGCSGALLDRVFPGGP